MVDSGAIHFGRAATVIVGSILSIAAFVLCSSAIYRNDWLIVYLHSTKQDHWHGLWRDCYQKQGEEVYCQLKVQRDDERCKIQIDKYDGKNRASFFRDDSGPRDDTYIHECYHDWQKGVLGLMIASVVCGLFALLFLVLSLCARIHAHISLFLHIVAFLCSTAACVWFYIVSFLKEFQWVNDQGDSRLAPQTRGVAFNFAVASAVLYVISAAFNFFAAALTCFDAPQGNRKGESLNNGGVFRPKNLNVRATSTEFNKNNGTFITEPTVIASPRSPNVMLPIHTVSASMDV